MIFERKEDVLDKAIGCSYMFNLKIKKTNRECIQALYTVLFQILLDSFLSMTLVKVLGDLKSLCEHMVQLNYVIPWHTCMQYPVAIERG